ARSEFERWTPCPTGKETPIEPRRGIRLRYSKTTLRGRPPAADAPPPSANRDRRGGRSLRTDTRCQRPTGAHTRRQPFRPNVGREPVERSRNKRQKVKARRIAFRARSPLP